MMVMESDIIDDSTPVGTTFDTMINEGNVLNPRSRIDATLPPKIYRTTFGIPNCLFHWRTSPQLILSATTYVIYEMKNIQAKSLFMKTFWYSKGMNTIAQPT